MRRSMRPSWMGRRNRRVGAGVRGARHRPPERVAVRRDRPPERVAHASLAVADATIAASWCTAGRGSGRRESGYIGGLRCAAGLRGRRWDGCASCCPGHGFVICEQLHRLCALDAIRSGIAAPPTGPRRLAFDHCVGRTASDEGDGDVSASWLRGGSRRPRRRPGGGGDSGGEGAVGGTGGLQVGQGGVSEREHTPPVGSASAAVSAASNANRLRAQGINLSLRSLRRPKATHSAAREASPLQADWMYPREACRLVHQQIISRLHTFPHTGIDSRVVSVLSLRGRCVAGMVSRQSSLARPAT